MRILPPRLFLIALLSMGVLGVLWPGPRVLGDPWRWLGVGPAALGVLINVSSALRFDRVGTNIKTFDRPDLLVTDGWFRWSRNPMYLGFTLALVGVAGLFGTLTPFIVALVFALVCDRGYIPFEERAMAARFGEAYADYRRRTRRWF